MNFGTIQVADIFVGALNATEAYFGTEKVWEKSAPPTGDWLCFTAERANSTVKLNKVGSPDAISIETSTDGSTWTDYSWTYNTGDMLTLANVGDKVYMRAKTENQTIGSQGWSYYKFVMSGRIAASGNIQTLLKADGTRTDAPYYCYFELFKDCQSLTSAPALPATTLADSCYSGMFSYCQALTTAPALPATTLVDYCYSEMFYKCGLTSAPALPAMTLADNCYSGMFQGCEALTTAPELPATTLTMSCYTNMFSECWNLTTAPELPATTLADNCYDSMFYGCSSLTSAPTLPATTLADYCYQSMFLGCSSLTTAPELPATDLSYGCYNQMFHECTSLTTAPELPADTLADVCYQGMFSQCSMLEEIKIGYTGEFSEDYFSNWVSGVAASGTFYYNGSDATEGDSAIPSGWTITPYTP